MPPPLALLGRTPELSRLRALVDRARAGHSAALVLSGEAGIGKSALLDALVAGAGSTVRVRRMVASESEAELTFAGLQLLCGDLSVAPAELPAPQREALEAAFGVRESGAPNPLVLGLAVRSLLAGGRGRRCPPVPGRRRPVARRRLGSHDRVGGPAPHHRTRGPRRRDASGRRPFRGPAPARPRGARRPGLPCAAAPGARRGDRPAGVRPARRGVPGQPARAPRAAPVVSRGPWRAGSRSPGPSPSRAGSSGACSPSSTPCRPATRTFLLLAAADPTGDAGLLWRASALLGLDPDNLDVAQQADVLLGSGRIRFRHPLIRSAVYRAATPSDRRAVHAALADATYAERDPDRRAWHRASATVQPAEALAAELVRSADRARSRGGVAAAAAFLERAAQLTPEPAVRVDRIVAAADSKLDAGAPEDALRLLDETRDHGLSPRQEALVGRLRARSEYALRRDRSAPRQLLAAARALEPHDPELARDTYMEALSAAVYAGRLGEPGAVDDVARAILATTAADTSDRAPDLILRGQALLTADGPAAALPTVRRAIHAFLESPPDRRSLAWMWFGGRAAQDVWDADGLRTLAERQVELARTGGVLTVLPAALNLLMVTRTFDGRLDEAETICDDIDTILSVTGHPLPLYGRTFVAAYRGRVEEVERRAVQLRTDAHARGEGYALTVANMAEALVYNGAGRYDKALASARGELPYVGELGHAMRTMLELVEAATHVGERAAAEEAVERLAEVTAPVVGTSPWADAFMALTRAQLLDGDEAEAHYRRAIDGFAAIRVPMLEGRSQLLYGERLRREGRRVDARAQLRAAVAALSASGMAAFAERARTELRATGEKVRTPDERRADALTEQERNVAQLARDGLTNRGDRRPALHQCAHRGVAPAEGLPEARHHVAPRAADRPLGREVGRRRPAPRSGSRPPSSGARCVRC